MKSYLSLIPISAKVRRRQNRITILCILISVLLVTTVFSMADMMIRTEATALREKHGNWHIEIQNLSSSVGEEIRRESWVSAVGWSETFNRDGDHPFYIGEKKAVLQGTDEAYMTQLTSSLEEGNFPSQDNQVILSSNAKEAIHAKLGDEVTLHTPAGDKIFTVCGFGSDDKAYYQGQLFLIGVYMDQTAFTGLMEENGIVSNPACYVRFQETAKAGIAISKLQEKYQLPEDSISENTAVMGISGQSSLESMKNIYTIAFVLFALVLLAGILMISGSLNSTVTQRTAFFGMLRCIGASRRQIIRFVRIEALNWCKTAVPGGLFLGTLITWGLCLLLHYGIGGEFATTPVFRLSPVGLVSGTLVGIVTVFLAAQSPARHAARVSPMAAVSGHTEKEPSKKRPSKLGSGKIDWILGFYHASASKKNWFLMAASYALSIILFFCFSVGLDFARELLPSLRSWQPDITFNGYANARILDQSLTNEIQAIPGVTHVFGISYINQVPVDSSRPEISSVSLASYSDYLLNCSESSVVQGDISAIYKDTHKVLTIQNKDNPLKLGDTLEIAGKEVQIACVLSDGLFSSESIVICSQKTFQQLMGQQDYSLIGVQLEKNAPDTTIERLSSLVSQDVIYSDMRESNRQDRATYWATRIIGYSFLAIIAMITAFHIINSISMSVTAHTKQYGTMRAVGMEGRQLTRMITAEAFTYAFSGLLAGCSVGLPLSRLLYLRLITRYFGTAWHLPVDILCIIFLFVFASAAVAVRGPSKRICCMAITETIKSL